MTTSPQSGPAGKAGSFSIEVYDPNTTPGEWSVYEWKEGGPLTETTATFAGGPPPEPDAVSRLADVWNSTPRPRRLTPREREARVLRRKQVRRSRRRNRR